MEKLVNKTLWTTSAVLYVMLAVKCAMVWEGGNGAARLGAMLPTLSALPLLTSFCLWLIGKFQQKLIIDADGTSALRRVVWLTLVLCIYIYGLLLFVPSKIQVHITFTICGTGAFMMSLGLAMPKLRRNRLAGARYSWTLTDPEVWNKSNAVGGVYTFLVGLLLVVSGAIPQRRVGSPFTTLEIWAILLYVVLLTLHSRLIALKHGDRKTE